MTATTRSIQATPRFGPLVAAFAAILVAMGLALALAYSQLGALQVTTAPISGSAQSMHDHGLSTAAAAAPRNAAAQYAHDRGWIDAAGAAPLTTVGWTTPPYTSSASTPAGTRMSGGNGTRFAR
jgi:hypothetical protein